MKWHVYLVVAGLFIASSSSFAQRDRSASCTENCTYYHYNHDYFESRLDRAHRGDTGSHADFEYSCSDRHRARHRNIHWCADNCLGHGGWLSQMKGRRDKVVHFLRDYDKFCSHLGNRLHLRYESIGDDIGAEPSEMHRHHER